MKSHFDHGTRITLNSIGIELGNNLVGVLDPVQNSFFVKSQKIAYNAMLSMRCLSE